MNYGFFDEQNKEYVITKPNTPSPWSNYLGSPEYGAVISNNAGGYSFVKCGAKGRIIRYRFNSVPSDQPGRYIYIHDNQNNDYWSASWQPVGKPLDEYQSECHHGMAYTNFISTYSEIKSEALYYVPLNQTYEVWRLRLVNNSTTERSLSVFGYTELSNDNNYEQDTVNLQYTQYISKTYYKDNMILQTINENCNKDCNGKNGLERFFAVVGANVSSYCGDRDAFVGEYRGYSNPIAVENGKCNNDLNFNGNSCGALQVDVVLKPGESKEIAFILGAHDDIVGSKIMDRYTNIKQIETELAELKSLWHGRLDNFQIKTPDQGFNNMINVWNSYQCFITFVWSRAASLHYGGGRNGFGYRDTVQDIQGIIHLDPDLALEKIRFMISGQLSNGGGLPLVKYDHNPGHEMTPESPEYPFGPYRADDALWLFPTVIKYINESGNIDFIEEVILYADKGESTVYEHLKRAILFSMERLGDHQMPAGLHADWNDCLRLGEKGESTFVAFQLYYALSILRQLAVYKNDTEYIEYLDLIQGTLKENIQKFCWENTQFIRGIREDGIVVGSKNDLEANIWLNPQSWAVISGFTDNEQANIALDTVYEKLNTKYGAMLLYPPYKDHAFSGALMQLFTPTSKENGGIFCQSQGWIILAETLIGNGDRAFQYYKESNPAEMNDSAEIRKIEPYVHGQFIEGKDSPFEGRAHVHWLTGTASTVMVACIEGILGMKPTIDGLQIDPCIPSDWKEFSIKRLFRGKWLNISVKNPNGSQKGVKELLLNSKLMENNLVPTEFLMENNDIIVIM